MKLVIESEMANGNGTNKHSSSPKGSDNDSENDPPHEDKKAPEKGSDKNEAPSPTSSSSSEGSGSTRSPPSKTSPSPSPKPSPPPPPPPRTPTSTKPPSSAPSPKESPPKKSPPAPQPPPPLSPPPPPPSPPPSSSTSRRPPSSPPPSPSSGEDENSSPPSPSKQSPPSSSESEAPSSSETSRSPKTSDNSSSSNSTSPSIVTPPSSSSPLQSNNSPPTLTRGDQASHSGSNHHSPPFSLGHSAGSRTRSGGSSDNSSPSTSGGGGDGDVSNPGIYVGIAFAGVFIIALIAVCLLVVILRKRKRGAVYDVSCTPPPMKAGAEGYYYVQRPMSDYTNGSQSGSLHTLGGASESMNPMSAQTAFSYESILEITDGFSSQNIIGEGGFGYVYKGWLKDGRGVAVKKLKAGSGQGEREFRAEVEIISRVHHRHLVSLVGYCISEQQKILMYEFVPNGTLDSHLHGNGMPVLDWTKRVKIAIGAAKGLAYLHEDCNPKIIHRDIKSSNILLDDAYEAQVSDFGLARLTDDGNTHVSTRVMGTFGYLAPEYATTGKLTDRSDVFSFGVVLLELITGRKPVDQTQPLGEESLVEWARPLLIHAVETGDFSKLLDPKLERHFVESEVRRMIEAAAACVRHSAPKRPRMLQVVRALDSESELGDLSNGMKYGQSTVYSSGQYDDEILRFRMMNGFSCGSSEFDMYSGEYNSRELSGFRRARAQDSSVVESQSLAFTRHTKEQR
ncbi:proline-rich receptor-like protein kinase PERK13 [Senna tora]|uniref:non-specific serine/threonine protein kinase n=1 Tax=Senna tora TaxID=362788 RepID=A0A834W5J9_9FABA|nr:proline-rich receptor-like protein kinase PERK13 [Senna tora]